MSKILIVEDDPDYQETLKLVLESEGYAVVTAGSAKEGLQKVRAENPNAILLDVMMPEGTEGFHFVWDLRKDENPALRDIPILILSAIHESTPFKFYPEQSDGVYGPGEYLPVQGFLDKPVAPDKLISEVKRLLGAG
jgi:two-component system alkaline phosphatase synthesis response regulator PhoP